MELCDGSRRAQAAGVLRAGERPGLFAGQFFSLLFRDLMLRLLLGVEHPPEPREVERRAKAATDAVLVLHAA
jgi:AefR-like transcriptional repressor, C-terminal domain